MFNFLKDIRIRTFIRIFQTLVMRIYEFLTFEVFKYFKIVLC